MTQSGQTVLYVEDEENDAVLLNVAFKRAGVNHRLQVVGNGKEALDYLNGAEPYTDRSKYPLPQLVLLDLNLPLMNGFEVLEKLRSGSQFNAMPILIYSSSEQAADQSRARALGANEYFVKPSRIDAIIEFAKLIDTKWLQSMRGQ